jgi:protein tyrosine/serine phosphatase
VNTALLLFLLHAVPHLFQVNDGLYRSGHLDAAGFDELDAKGIKSVLSLEDYPAADAAAENALAVQHHMTYVNLPMSGYDKPEVATIEVALAQIAKLPQPVLVHCFLGRDRTGIVVGAYRITHDGWDAQRAIKEMRDRGHLTSLYWWDDVLYEIH